MDRTTGRQAGRTDYGGSGSDRLPTDERKDKVGSEGASESAARRACGGGLFLLKGGGWVGIE